MTTSKVASKKTIVLDTNFLMIPAQFKVDIFQEIRRLMNEPYQLCIYAATLDELKKLADSRKKDASAANIALVLIKQQNLKILPNSSLKTASSGYLDEILVKNADASMIIATQDAALRKTLKAMFPGIKFLVMHAHRLILQG